MSASYLCMQCIRGFTTMQWMRHINFLWYWHWDRSCLAHACLPAKQRGSPGRQALSHNRDGIWNLSTRQKILPTTGLQIHHSEKIACRWIRLWFVAERSKAEGRVVQSLKSSDLLKDDRTDAESLRALVDNWLTAAKKLSLLSEELVWRDFFETSLTYR